MKKAVVVVCTFLLVTSMAWGSEGGKIGVGACAGMNIPIVQDDASSGLLYGVKARWEFMPNMGVEAYYQNMDQGESSVEVWDEDMTLDGGSLSHFGLNVFFGSVSGESGAHFHVSAGIASYSLDREGTLKGSRIGFNVGPALEIGLGKMMSIEIEPKFHIMTLDGGGSRKNVGISGGFNYYFDLKKQ